MGNIQENTIKISCIFWRAEEAAPHTLKLRCPVFLITEASGLKNKTKPWNLSQGWGTLSDPSQCQNVWPSGEGAGVVFLPFFCLTPLPWQYYHYNWDLCIPISLSWNQPRRSEVVSMRRNTAFSKMPATSPSSEIRFKQNNPTKPKQPSSRSQNSNVLILFNPTQGLLLREPYWSQIQRGPLLQPHSASGCGPPGAS